MPYGKIGSLIKLSKSYLSTLEKKAVLKVLDKAYLGMGDEVATFEKNLKLPFFQECLNNF